MKFALAVAAWLLLPVVGRFALRIDAVRRMPSAGRIAFCGVAGALTTGCVMFTMSVIGLPWTRLSLFLILGAIAAIGFLPVAGDRGPSPQMSRPAMLVIAVFLALTTYGALDSRESSGDLHYFWGPKAVRFFRAGHIDTTFLRNPDFYQMHPDYPPLLPLLYGWTNVLSGDFSWMAALAATPLLLLAIACVVWSTAGDAWGTVLIVATLAQAMAVGFAAGAAEPLLILFETTALAALLFVRDDRSRWQLAALGLAGAAWTKIEGTTFLIAVVVALILVRRQWRESVKIVVPALILIAAWTVFISHAGVLDMYAAAGRYPIHFSALPKTIKLVALAGSYDVFWIPWIVPAVLIAMGDVRRAILPLVICVLTICAAVYFYIHADDPTWWIAASAPRVLLTPLMALDLAAIAAWTDVTALAPPLQSSHRSRSNDPSATS
jgi:hypothetical protein